VDDRVIRNAVAVLASGYVVTAHAKVQTTCPVTHSPTAGAPMDLNQAIDLAWCYKPTLQSQHATLQEVRASEDSAASPVPRIEARRP